MVSANSINIVIALLTLYSYKEKVKKFASGFARVILGAAACFSVDLVLVIVMPFVKGWNPLLTLILLSVIGGLSITATIVPIAIVLLLIKRIRK